jgi:hypothetical protein
LTSAFDALTVNDPTAAPGNEKLPSTPLVLVNPIDRPDGVL